MLSLLLATAQAASPAALRAGLDNPSGWELVDRVPNDVVGEIVVRHKTVEGVDCLEGTAYARLAPDALLRAATDIPSQPKWSSWDVAASVQLSTGASFDYYQVLDNPIPVSDRYWFLRGTRVQSGTERAFRWELIDAAKLWPQALAEVRARFPSAVLTTANVGDWTFTPEADRTRVRYRVCTDPGGSIPKWAGDVAATRTLPTNIADLIRETARRGGR